MKVCFATLPVNTNQLLSITGGEEIIFMELFIIKIHLESGQCADSMVI